MLEKYYLQASSNVVALNRVMLIVIVALVIITIMNYQMAKNYINEARTVLVTPNMAVKDSQYIITSDEASQEYIRKVVHYAMGLYLNYSPTNVGSQFEELIVMYSPDTYEQERIALMDLRDRVIESARITSTFVMDPNMIYDPETKSVKVKGIRTKFSREGSANRVLESVEMKYKFDFTIRDGHLFILQIRES